MVNDDDDDPLIDRRFYIALASRPVDGSVRTVLRFFLAAIMRDSSVFLAVPLSIIIKMVFDYEPSLGRLCLCLRRKSACLENDVCDLEPVTSKCHHSSMSCGPSW